MADTVLIVDDDPNVLNFLSRILTKNGLHVFTASNGQAALKTFQTFQPNLVLSDVSMPMMNGFEVCHWIKQHPEFRLTPVVLLTGMADSESRIKGINAGADDFLSKPLDQTELMARVRSLLRQKSYTDELENVESVLFALARSIEGKDAYTQGHCERLSEYSVQLGKRIGLPSDQLIALRRAGIVHDIGKVAIPDAILLKPGILSPEEWLIMQEHPLVGERICAPLRSFRLVVPIIRHHHEKMDGSGYPDGLSGEDIPLTARVLQTVDIFDALTTDRPYRTALSAADAINEMRREVGLGWWDGNLVEELAKEVAVYSTLDAESVHSCILSHGNSNPICSQAIQPSPSQMQMFP